MKSIDDQLAAGFAAHMHEQFARKDFIKNKITEAKGVRNNGDLEIKINSILDLLIILAEEINI